MFKTLLRHFAKHDIAWNVSAKVIRDGRLLYKVWSYLSGEQEAAATRASRAMVLGIMVTGVDRAVKVVLFCSKVGYDRRFCMRINGRAMRCLVF